MKRPAWADELMHETGALIATDDMPIIAMASMPFSLSCVLTLGIITYTGAVCEVEAPVATYTKALFACWTLVVMCNCAVIYFGSRGNVFQRRKRAPGVSS
jgi:hypothetical protein